MSVEELVSLLESSKKRAIEIDEGETDFNPADIFGGNFDDAFWGGYDLGWNSCVDFVLTQLKQDETS